MDGRRLPRINKPKIALHRLADHATNIATDVIFWVRGADVRHPLSAAE
jgi:phosphate transport system protein